MNTGKTQPKTRHPGVLASRLLAGVAFAAGFGSPPVWAQTDGCNNNATQSDSGAPCFANVSDILQGQRRLLPVDDLVVTSQPEGPGSAVSNVVLQTANSSVSAQLPYAITGSGVPSFATSAGRMFNLPRDVIVTMTEGLVNVRDQDPNGFITKGFSLSGNPHGMAMDDFNGDGFADIALLTADAVGSTSGLLRIVTANDVNNLDAGLFASNGVGPFQFNFTNPISITTGDFNGDGKPEVAIAQPFSSGGAQLLLQIYEIVTTQDGKIASQALRQAASVVLNSPVSGQVIWSLKVVAGSFDGNVNATTGLPTDEIVLVVNNGDNLTLQSFRVQPQSTNPLNFDITLINTFVSPDSLYTNGNTAGDPLLATSGHLDWFNPAEQVVAAYTYLTDSTGNNFSWKAAVFTLDSQLNIAQAASIDTGGAVNLGLAVGNFDEDLGPDSPPNLEIARVLSFSLPMSQNQPYLEILRADPANSFALSVASNMSILGFPPFFNSPLLLVAGDTQGRSLLLGPPEKVTVTNHIQPDTILGLPPMHVDWITPAGGSVPDVLNVSVFPNTFNTQYNFQDTTGTQASRKSTTSYTVAFKESAEEKVSYGVPGIDSVSVKLTQAATQTHQNTVAKTYNTYQGNSFKLTAQTLFDDRVAATAEQFNIYSYPVIGHCVPVSGAPPLDGCPAGTAPLHVQFSGPDNVVYLDLAEGAAIEWYQPVHEPGNALSYPGSLELLKANLPAANPLQPLSPDNEVWDSQSPEQVSITWTQGGGNDVTSGSVSTHTFDTSVSVSGSTNIEGFGLSGSASFDYNQSQSVSTLNTSASTFSDSTGVIVNRGIPGGPTSSENYLYQGQSFIFGQAAPTGTIDTLTTNTTVQAQGFLAVGFASDPLSTGTVQSGNWWKQAYAHTDANGNPILPDVALNHPQRWLQKTPTGTNPQQVWFNCPVGFTSSQTSPACTAISQTPTPANVADAPFYQMKGLFVTPGTTPGGPQITQTPQGQTVTLQARVYNYSLSDMPAGTVVHVLFYAQPWDGATGQFQSQAGNPDAFAPAVLIGEDQLAAIPAFCGGSQGDVDPCAGDSPPQNWVYAKATWDTSTVAADTDWKFWVVAWMEQGGQLVPEIQDHGLRSIPASLLNSLADVPIETYSNNLGFYNQVFHVASASPAPATGSGALTIDRVAAPSGPVLLHQPVTIRASHRSGGPRFDSVLTLFYDGDPEAGGMLFDQELIPRVRASDTFVAPVPYRPGTCGTHQIFVQAIPTDGSAEPATGTATVQVIADFPAELASLGQAIQAADLPRGLEKGLLAQIKTAGKLLDRGHTAAAQSLLTALKHEIRALARKKISPEITAPWLEEVDLILGCIIT
ncbi:hypothetical protein ACR2R6_03145 [Methylocaldum gracile subsp. desertum]|uniref:hypothetical protein n=1 Tax=Methylocaldum sp. GT1BW TaxID=3438964 RepID=UPI003DA0F68A